MHTINTKNAQKIKKVFQKLKSESKHDTLIGWIFNLISGLERPGDQAFSISTILKFLAQDTTLKLKNVRFLNYGEK